MIYEEGIFTLGNFVEWSLDKQVNLLKTDLKSQGKRHIKSSLSNFNRINSFMVCTVELTRERKEKTRKKINHRFNKTLQAFSKNVLKEYNNEIFQKGDPSKYYIKYLKKANYKTQSKYLKKKRDESIKTVSQYIQDIITKGSVLLWDLPGHEDDRVIIGDDELKFEDILHGVGLYTTIDELLIVSFATLFIPISNTLIQEILSEFEALAKHTNKLKSDTYVPVVLNEVFHNFIGTISALQETLKLFEREIKMVSQISNEATTFLKKLPSKDINEWLDKSNLSGKDPSKLIQSLAKKIETIKPDLRMFSDGQSEIDKTTLEPIIDGIVNIYPLVIGLSLWVSKFQDIPSFTVLTDGIGYERFEGEKYAPHPGSLIECQKIFRTYQRGSSTIYALRGVSIEIKKGEFLIIRGPSGAGKTTLLNIIAGLDNPSRGAVFFKNRNTVPIGEERKAHIRKNHYAFIFQSYALIPHLNTFENTKLPLDMGEFPKEFVNEIDDLLEDVGISQYKKNKPAMLSGGQMQRLAIARALIKKPDILFADEPTGDLDEVTGRKILELFKKYHDKLGITIVMVTHDPEAIKYADREILIQDGRIVKKLVD
ncbi:MAG: ABC transporter ATP-binding protein [Candidatus Heimdallarchaeota archaeon]|nr:ABC transporter ATP-binding protein [Candidatus Heimdallarchaeota archaeon]MDH5646183.1 ABC transporter ATP-binding protein [Candidatus Heimdallarchaeota archaeon]